MKGVLKAYDNHVCDTGAQLGDGYLGSKTLLFLQKSENPLYIHKGRFPSMERYGLKFFSWGFTPRPPIFFSLL